MRLLLILASLLSYQAKASENWEIMEMISHAPMARLYCNKTAYTKDCDSYVRNKILEEMLDSGFTQEQAEACAIVSLENDAALGSICAGAFGLDAEYKEFLNK